MSLNKYLPFAYIYFFINAVALPFGLTYTALLAPFFYVWVLLARKKEVLLPFIIMLLPFIIVHLTIVDAEVKSYAVSLLNLLLVYIFCQAVYTFLLVCRDIEKIFRGIVIMNFIVCLLAIPLYFTPWSFIAWDEQVLTEGVGRLRRLKLFTYEPSYYALLFTPFFFFFLLQYFFRQSRMRGIILLPMLILPYILSLSVGVTGAIFLSGLITWIIHFRKLTKKRRIANAIITGGVLVVAGVLILILFFGNNQVFARLSDILSGRDNSARGRTVDAFLLASKILQEKNEYFGVGLGQVKIVGDDIIRNYYLYNMDITVSIPNAAAETLAIFGWVGIILRIAIELFLFMYTRVWTNYYRLLLFIFMFVYQFTGSFITNIAEYVIWILAFTNVFHQFNAESENETSGATLTGQERA